jgi:hypothetical protein
MARIKLILFLTALFLSFAYELSGQVIGGRIIQIQNGEPVPFTTIAIEGTTLGMVTDFDGNFVFEIPGDRVNSNLVISCVGYKERKMKLSGLIGKLDLIIELESSSVEIDEVVVEKKSLLPYSIVKKAAEAVKDNYINKPYNYELYLKTESRTVSGKLHSYESVILFYDKSGYYRSNAYKTFKDLNYRVLQAKRNYKVDDLNSGNIHLDDLLEFDIVRHMNNVLDKRRIYDFDIMIKDELVHKNDSAWVIIYKCSKPDLLRTGDVHAVAYSGEMIISKKDYAVLYNKTDVKSAGYSGLSRNLLVEDNQSGSKVKSASYSFETIYRWDGYYYAPDEISMKLDLNYTNPDKDLLKTKESVLKVKKININDPTVVDTRQYFDQTEYDPGFWSGYK